MIDVQIYGLDVKNKTDLSFKWKGTYCIIRVKDGNINLGFIN